MIIVDTALRQREATGSPIGVALSGAGFAAQGLVMQLLGPASVGIRLRIIANRTIETIHTLLDNLDVDDFVEVRTIDELEAAIASETLAITDDVGLAALAPDVEVFVEATGTVEYGASAVLLAIASSKHIVLLNAELDATLGPILKVLADRAGVVLTDIDGDQPGVLMNLKRQVESWGFRPLLLANIKSLLDHQRNPDTQMEFARAVWQRPQTVASFADGSKIAFEMATLANGTGMGVLQRGMLGPEVRADVGEAHRAFDAEQLIAGEGYVDYVLGAEPSFGVFIIGHSDELWRQRYMEVYKMGPGPLYTFYAPYHLGPLETPLTIARVALFGDATLTPIGDPVVGVIAVAKRDLEVGDVLDGIGGFCAYGLADNVADSTDLLPMGLSSDCRVLQRVPKGEPISFSAVRRPRQSVAWDLWDEQRQMVEDRTIGSPDPFNYDTMSDMVD